MPAIKIVFAHGEDTTMSLHLQELAWDQVAPNFHQEQLAVHPKTVAAALAPVWNRYPQRMDYRFSTAEMQEPLVARCAPPSAAR